MGFFDNFARSIGLRDENTITYSDCEQLYKNGNYKKAFERCLKFTMENEDPRVWTMLGEMYKTGKGCMVNPTESFNWMFKAASAGIPEVSRMVLRHNGFCERSNLSSFTPAALPFQMTEPFFSG